LGQRNAAAFGLIYKLFSSLKNNNFPAAYR